MANEFVVKNGLISQNNIIVTGSISATGGITGSLSGNAATASYVATAQTASYVATAQTASYVLNARSASYVQTATTASYVLNAVSASRAISSSYASTSSYADTFTVGGTLTAQTLVVQTITSSVDFVTGSTRFGSISANTHQFTGSVGMSGSLSVLGASNLNTAVVSGSLTVSGSTGTIASYNSDILEITGSLVVSGSTTITGSLNVNGVISGTFSGSFENAVSASYAATASYSSAVTGTSGNISKFTGANTIGDSIMYQDGSGIHFSSNGTSSGARILISPDTPQGYIAAYDSSGNFYKLVLQAGALSVRYDTNRPVFDIDSDGKVSISGSLNTTGSITTNGITFPATQVASADANTLDDYEEGTWTPTITGGGGNPTITYSSGNTGGIYTKIGNIVTISFEVRWSSISGGSGAAIISGLPFTRRNTNLPDGDRLIVDSYNNTLNGLYLVGNIGTGTGIGLSLVRSGNITLELLISNLGNSNPSFLRGSVTYFV